MQLGNKLSESIKSFNVVVEYPFEKLFKDFFKIAFAF